jgi:hypothetical protein
MKNSSFLLASLLVAGLAAGCTTPEAHAQIESLGPLPAPPALAPVTADPEAAKAPAWTLRDHAFAQKAEFVVEMNQELAALQVELGRLAVKVDQAGGAAKLEARIALEKARVQWAAVQKHLVEVERAPEPTWNEMKVGFRKAYGELQEAVTRSRHWLSEKIEP